MDRLYVQLLEHQLRTERQMVFLTEPRQVGKSTTATLIADKWTTSYVWDWDTDSGRTDILAGQERITDAAGLNTPSDDLTLLVFDELHKYRKWKDFLKGLFDTTEDRARILVTGSARLDVYRPGGDSLMGRYFPWRMHPLSPGELIDASIPPNHFRLQGVIQEYVVSNLLQYGGFPEPYTNQSTTFSTRWKRTRSSQLFREDIRDLSRIQNVDQLEHLAELLRHRAGQLTSLTFLSKKVRTSINTVSSWLKTLESFYYCFPVRPYFNNVTRALRKEPKYYLCDWSNVPSVGQKTEDFIACMLLKSVRLWTDLGLGEYGLHFVRDKDGRDVDFLVTENNEPWFLVEAKTGDGKFSPNLARFQDMTGAKHAFQISMNADPTSTDIFNLTKPTIISARSFLSRLL